MAQDASDNIYFGDDGSVEIPKDKLEIDQVAVTTTAAALNKLDGVTATTAELNKLDGVTATTAEINMAADSSANVELVTAANTITAAESGKTFFLNSATGFASTLPAKAAGLRFRFVVSTQPTSGNHTVVCTNDDNTIQGTAVVNGASVAAADEGSINFIASTAVVGDYVEVYNDGTNWLVWGLGQAAGGITFTT